MIILLSYCRMQKRKKRKNIFFKTSLFKFQKSISGKDGGIQMKIIFDIALFIEFLFHGYSASIYCSAIFKEKISRFPPLLLFLCASGIEFIVYKVFYSVPVNMITIIVLTTLASFICYNTKLLSCFFHAAVLSCVMCAVEIMVVPVENLVLSDNYLQTHSMTTELFGSTVTKLLFFIFCKLVSRFSEKESESIKSLWLFVVPVISLLCSLMVMSLNDYYNEEHFETVLIVFAISIMIINTVVFIVHESYVKNMYETARLKLSEQKNRLDYEHYNILQENYNNSRILVHDFKHHMKMIAAMTENEDILSLKEYVKSMQIQEKDFSSNYITGNKIVDVILYEEAEKCKKQGIAFHYTCNNVSFDFMNDADICCILSNLFDNAIESAEKSKDRRIEAVFYTKDDKTMLFIEISNSSDISPETKNGSLITNKKDKDNHGIGLYSIEKNITKYDGFLSYKYNESEHIFKVVITLNTK